MSDSEESRSDSRGGFQQNPESGPQAITPEEEESELARSPSRATTRAYSSVPRSRHDSLSRDSRRSLSVLREEEPSSGAERPMAGQGEGDGVRYEASGLRVENGMVIGAIDQFAASMQNDEEENTLSQFVPAIDDLAYEETEAERAQFEQEFRQTRRELNDVLGRRRRWRSLGEEKREV